MILTHIDKGTEGIIRLVANEHALSFNFFSDNAENLITLFWNRGADQVIQIDDVAINFKFNQVIPLTANQSFIINELADIVAWQFNRSFYCIITHDAEVSCVGLLFYGGSEIPVLEMGEKQAKSLSLLYEVFLDEFEEPDDNLKSEMLRVVLKRLIVKLTRIYKIQYDLNQVNGSDLDVIRKFNLLVEKHYLELHQVQDYADLLFRSPKTISNIFSKCYNKSPLQVIHERIILEVKRLLIYTDKSAKEIAHEVGFQEFSNFSRFFKKNMDISPSQFRARFNRKY